MKNKILILLLLLIKFFTGTEVFSCSAPTGQETHVTSNLIYTLSKDRTYYEVSANRENYSSITELTIPATFRGKPVSIIENAFDCLPELTTLKVEGAYGDIGKNAFSMCFKLKRAEIKGNGLAAVNGFTYCDALEEVILGEGIYSIGAECFYKCTKLKRIVISDDCEYIGINAFNSCSSLRDVSLGKGLEIISEGAFRYCTSLESIDFPTEKTLYVDRFAFEYSGLLEIHIPENLRFSGEYAFGHVAWDGDDTFGVSHCKAVYFYSQNPTVEYLGTNSIGYTWNRSDFKVYVPANAIEKYRSLMLERCDESWKRCVLDTDKLATFTP